MSSEETRSAAVGTYYQSLLGTFYSGVSAQSCFRNGQHEVGLGHASESPAELEDMLSFQGVTGTWATTATRRNKVKGYTLFGRGEHGDSGCVTDKDILSRMGGCVVNVSSIEEIHVQLGGY